MSGIRKTRPAEKAATSVVGAGVPTIRDEGNVTLEKISVFGESAGKLVADALKRHDGDRVEALKDFMYRESDERNRQAKAAGRKEDWNDANNAWHSPLMFSPADKIASGEDVELIRQSLATTKMPNIAERRKLADVYFLARRRLFPEAPFPTE